MRIAFVGKGGSGKTTITSLLFRYLENMNKPLLAIDADINQHLAGSVAWDAESPPELGNNLKELKKILKGINQKIPSESEMIKTTLPGAGSHLIKLDAQDPVLDRFAVNKKNAWLMRIGGFMEDDIGQKCYHAKTGAAELILNHLVDSGEETIIMDMTAGADAFASGLFGRFDLTVLVVEPTMKSVSVYNQYKDYAKEYEIPVVVVGNKVEDANDIAFLEEKCSNDLIGCVTKSAWVKQTEQGRAPEITSFEPENTKILEKILHEANKYPRDWNKYWALGRKFHLLNATGWANDALGCDVTNQIDNDFLRKFQGMNFEQFVENNQL